MERRQAAHDLAKKKQQSTSGFQEAKDGCVAVALGSVHVQGCENGHVAIALGPVHVYGDEDGCVAFALD